MPAHAHDTEPLLSAYHFNYTQRPRRDSAWALTYILLLLLTLGWALLSLIFRPDLLRVLASPDYLDDPNHCPITLGATTTPSSSAASTPEFALTSPGLHKAAALDPSGTSHLSPPGHPDSWPRSSLVSLSGGIVRAVAVVGQVLRPASSRTPAQTLQPGEPQHEDDPQRPRLELQQQRRRRQRHMLGAESEGAGSGGATGGSGAGAGAVEADDVIGVPSAAGSYREEGLPSFGARDATGGSSDGAFRNSPVPRVLLDFGGLLLLFSMGAAVALALLFVLALRYSPRALVLLACGLQVGAPLAAAVVASKAGNSTLALILLIIAAATAVSLYCGRHALALASRLLGLAAVALRQNPSLLVLVIALKVALAGATALLMAAVALVGAAGDVVPNPQRAGNPRCATPAGQPVTCCAMAPAPGLAAYLPAAAITLAWTLVLLFEVKVFVVSGVVAQWHFSPAGHLAGWGYYGSRGAGGGGGGGGGGGSAAGGAAAPLLDGGGEESVAAGSVCVCGERGGFQSSRALLASLGYALGPSFGSLCAASGVLGATSYLRVVVNSVASRSRRHAALQYPGGAPVPVHGPAACSPCCACGGGFCCLSCLGSLLEGCCWCVTSLLEQLTKFATVQMSMSGLGFWNASKEVVALLRRNYMDAYNMWWYLPMVLHCGGAAFAAAWGYTAYWLARQCWEPFTHSAPLDARAAATLGTLAAATAELVLAFVCSVLVNIADALFICFVLDRDSGAVTWYDLHCTFAALPCCATARAVAEGQYAAATAAPPSYYYVPPSASYGGAPAVPYVPYGYQVAPAPTLLPPGVHQSPQLAHTVGYGQPTQRPQYGGTYGGGGGGGGGFWGWLRSPSGSGSGMYGMPVGGSSRYRSDRPQHPPPAILSPPYSDQRFPVQQTLAGPPPPFLGGSLPPS